ncbi:MAG: hypothetical protein ACRCU6_00160 [Fusobacteriaceae bacterium]
MTKIKKEIDVAVENKARMYIGPNLVNEGLTNGTVVRGEFDNRMQSIVEKYPLIKYLFVVVDKDLAVMKRNITIKGTMENTIFNKVLETIGGKR